MYDKQFDPAADQERPLKNTDGAFPDDSQVYVFDDERLVLAVNVAMATGRPLLVYGPPGAGKSALAPNVARILNWRFLSHMVDAKTEVNDLLWRFDALGRLNDASVGRLNDDLGHYYEPAILWKAFSPPPLADGPPANERSVVLVDEVDKADPDLPNSLLGPLGSLKFTLPWGVPIVCDKGSSPLVVITTNNDRQLSPAFIRRCIIVELKPPTRGHLLKVAERHLGTAYEQRFANQVADYFERLEPGPESEPPSTAEYLDTLKACVQLGVGPGDPQWEAIAEVALRKRRSR